MLDRQTLRLRLPDQCCFIAFDREQVAHHVGLTLFSRASSASAAHTVTAMQAFH